MSRVVLDGLIVAGGSSRRMGFDKILAQLAGRPVLLHSLEAFQKTASIRHVVVVCPAGREDEFRALCGGFPKVLAVVAGGDMRSDSVANGLAALPPIPDGNSGWVAVHDAARPLILPESIEECFREAVAQGAAALAERVADTLHRCDPERRVLEQVPRENLWRVQTPQILSRGDFSLLSGGATDEVTQLVAGGRRVILVENPHPNFKLTVPGDLLPAEAVLRARHS